MTTLIDLVPDADVLLALPTEELANVLLQSASRRRQNGLVHPQMFIQDIAGQPGVHPGYPQGKRAEIELAIGEALNWLGVQGILIPDTGSNGNNGWMRLSRKGQRLLRVSAFRAYASAAAFPKSMLHPAFAEEVWLDLARADFPTAVFKAFRAVEIAVRDAAHMTNADYGTDLMRKAFDPKKGPLIRRDQPESEREALAHLFAGAIGSYKNPHSHRAIEIEDPVEAQEMVILASHLLRIVESRKP